MKSFVGRTHGWTVCFALIAVLASWDTPVSQASTSSARPHFAVSKEFPVATFSDYDWPTEGEIPALKETIKRFENREIASDQPGTVSDKLKEIQTAFLKVKDADGLDTLIKTYDAQYDKKDDSQHDMLPADAKYIVAQLAILVPFRGFVFKTTKLATSTHGTDTVAYYGITQVATLMSVLLPTLQWQAVFDYLVSADPADKGQFAGISFIQNYLVKSVVPVLDNAARRMAALGKDMNGRPFFFDRLFLYGTANFQDAVDNVPLRYKMIGPAEINGVIASLHFALHDILVLSSYNLEDFINVKHSLSNLYAKEGIILGHMEMLTAEQRFGTLTHSGLLGDIGMGGFPDYLKARIDTADGKKGESYAKEQMPVAFKHLQAGIKRLALAWGVVQKEGSDELANQYAIMRPVRILPYSNEVALRLKTLQDMVKGKTAVRSFVTGKEVTVNLPNYYANPPEDLKDFMPTQFQPKDSARVAKYFRDYFYGQPVAWNLEKFAPYVEIPAGGDIRDVTRIISQSWLGVGAMAPFLSIVR